MSDRDALLAAICAQPTRIRLDWCSPITCEENGEAPRAAFIRTQVELARTLPWEPFAGALPVEAAGRDFRQAVPRDASPGGRLSRGVAEGTVSPRVRVVGSSCVHRTME